MDVTFKDVTLRFKNFSGRETDFNAEGNRNFHVDLTEDMVDYLNNVELTTKSGRTVKGANVKTYVPKASDDNPNPEPRYSIKILFIDQMPRNSNLFPILHFHKLKLCNTFIIQDLTRILNRECFIMSVLVLYIEISRHMLISVSHWLNACIYSYLSSNI